MRKFIAFMLTFMLALVFIGCGETGGETINPTKIKIEATVTEVTVDETISLKASFEPTNATEKKVTWESSDENIAKVSNGTVKGIAVGEVTITVTSNADSSVKDSITITVKEAAKVLPTAVKISGATEVIPGIEEALWLTFTPADTTEKGVTWSSSDEAIATVDEDGKVTGIAAGTVKISVVSTADPNVKAELEIEVLSAEDIVPVWKLDIYTDEILYITKTPKTLYISRSILADTSENASAKPTKTTLTWTSSDESIATVDSTGRVTGVAAGTVTISATTQDGTNLTATCEVTVVVAKAPTSYKVSSTVGEDGLKLGRGASVVVEVGEGEDASSEYVSSDENVATVDESGVITSVGVGEVTITATSLVDPSKSGSVTFTVNNQEVETKPQSVTINGEDTVYAGYSINLVATVAPINAVQSVTWSSSNEEVATVDQTGKVTALKPGTVRITATSTVDKGVSVKFKLEVEEEPPQEPFPNMGGYKIIIMNADSALTDNDPFLEGYSGADKAYKQRAWTEVETNYNCDIVVEAYPAVAPWGPQRIKWIQDNAASGTSQCDLAVISSNWIHEFATSSSAVDVSDYYKQYGLKQMEPSVKQAGTFQNKLYVASTGISPISTYIDLGLYYDLTWAQKLGVKDPAKMFLDGEWTYSGFSAWVKETQAKLGEGQYVFGGHPYYYYYGLTNAAGVKIADAVTVEVNIDSPASKAACDLIYELVQAGCCDEVASWAESDGGFIDRTTLMTTGYLWFVRNDSRWKKDMFGDDTKYGYVPFPYPDTVEKENTRIGVSGLSVMLYVAGRTYPAGVTTKDVYRAINDMFLNTIKYVQADGDFDAEVVKRTALQARIDNPDSIDCILYYDASKVFYDPAHAIYGSTSATHLRQPAIDVMYKGEDFTSTFGEVYDAFNTEFKKVYS
ncbi:MAG: Ig-like domain-containing protein [Bacilli bacterium]|nr:Ig-like domain-containing protein [Bacilli bacterium]